ncbi:uncharacterized protein LOC131038363 isoform X2 [Cryptomeria japonica]|uniref:uncharacterized protein LOC131038363 isoform X2 n=1 Tax=Cryptomeria japonica TaxID=3369 RepID=UPI0025AD7636|nr:uncharacterized protein LOC131038363 isoform X2 [Cryptomeria japonica]
MALTPFFGLFICKFVFGTLSLADHEHYFSNGQMVEDEKWWVGTDEQVIQGRSDIESLDYPPSGANHSHEPGGGSKPPIKNSP